MLDQVVAHTPQAARLTHALHGVQPSLLAGPQLIPSQQATQRGNLLGMLPVPLALQPLIECIRGGVCR